MVVLLLIFWGLSILFSVVAASAMFHCVHCGASYSHSTTALLVAGQRDVFFLLSWFSGFLLRRSLEWCPGGRVGHSPVGHSPFQPLVWVFQNRTTYLNFFWDSKNIPSTATFSSTPRFFVSYI